MGKGEKRMTIQEMIRILKMEMLGDSEQMECAKQIAAGALEKQIPKKPILDSRTCRYVDYQEFFCPYCRNRIISRLDGDFIIGRKQKHCDNCGQALDWEDVK